MIVLTKRLRSKFHSKLLRTKLKDEDTIKIFKSFLDQKARYFNVSIKYQSKCVDVKQRAEQSKWGEKIVVITKIRE